MQAVRLVSARIECHLRAGGLGHVGSIAGGAVRFHSDSPLAPAPFANRFEKWGSSPPPALQQRVSQQQSGISTQLDPRNIRVLNRVSSNSRGAEKASPSLPDTANQSPLRTGKPPGIVTGQLKDQLVAIQRGHAPDAHGWVERLF